MPYPDTQADAAAKAAAPPARLVFYEYCISLVFITLRRPSRLHLLPAGSWGFWEGVPYTLVTLLLGWWGLPGRHAGRAGRERHGRGNWSHRPAEGFFCQDACGGIVSHNRKYLQGLERPGQSLLYRGAKPTIQR